jgi:hypothetical protein
VIVLHRTVAADITKLFLYSFTISTSPHGAHAKVAYITVGTSFDSSTIFVAYCLHRSGVHGDAVG